MTAPKLLAYTTSVPAGRTVEEIQRMLVKAGARRIVLEYDGERVLALSFTLVTIHGERPYVLPANVTAVRAVLTKQGLQPRYRTVEQAERVAWRILAAWVAAQLAIIETGMVSADRVFLPYQLVARDRTVYDEWVDQVAIEAAP